jgi:hypothetical protein
MDPRKNIRREQPAAIRIIRRMESSSSQGKIPDRQFQFGDGSGDIFRFGDGGQIFRYGDGGGGDLRFG